MGERASLASGAWITVLYGHKCTSSSPHLIPLNIVRRHLMDGELDFSGYTDRELREAQVTIDRSKYPLNASRLADELRARQLSGTSIEFRHSEKHSAPAPLPQLESSITQIQLVAID